MREMEKKCFIAPKLGSEENTSRTMWKKTLKLAFVLLMTKRLVKDNKIGKQISSHLPQQRRTCIVRWTEKQKILLTNKFTHKLIIV